MTGFKHGLQKWHLKNDGGIQKIVYAAEWIFLNYLGKLNGFFFFFLLSIVSVITQFSDSTKMKIRYAMCITEETKKECDFKCI